MIRIAAALSFVLILSGCSSKPKTESVAAQPSGPQILEMSATAQQHIGLKTALVGYQDLQEYLHVVGTVQPIDTRIGHIRPLARGRVQQVLVRVGDRVQTGQELARFDNIEAGELQAQYQGALAELARLRVQESAAARIAEREKQLVNIGAVAQKTAELSQTEAQAARESVRVQQSVVLGIASRLRRYGVEQASTSHPSTVIRAPFSGVVIQAQTAPGDVVDVDRELFSIADLSRVWVQAEVYEQDIGRVKIGQPATITVDTYPGEKFEGQVTYIGDILDPKTRTAKVRCEAPNPEIRLKLDMFTAVELPTHFSRRALVAPSSAIQEINGKAAVFVRKGPTSFEMRAVKTGKTLDEVTEIESGLRDGESVVSNGSFHLKSIALSGQIGEEE